MTGTDHSHCAVTPAGCPGRSGTAVSGGAGYQARHLLGRRHGSLHLDVTESFLAPGGTIDGHRHPHEESFFVLRGAPLVAIGEVDYQLRAGDFGVIPFAMPHAWANREEDEATWLTVRAPQPRPIGHAGTYRVHGTSVPTGGRTAEEADPSARHVGHFDEGDLPAPGRLSMPGYHGPNLRNVSIRVMVDELLGAEHHTLFIVQLEPTVTAGAYPAQHYHPFEEMYYLLSGAAEASFGDDHHDLRAGDLAWTGVNASHGFINPGREPVRWVEAQAPTPPRSDGFIFEADWRRLAERDGAFPEEV